MPNSAYAILFFFFPTSNLLKQPCESYGLTTKEQKTRDDTIKRNEKDNGNCTRANRMYNDSSRFKTKTSSLNQPRAQSQSGAASQNQFTMNGKG